MALLGVSRREMKEKIKEKTNLTDEEAERAIDIVLEVFEMLEKERADASEAPPSDHCAE